MMQQSAISLLESINPLIKLVKQREDLYFELLSFVNSHIQSSSNDLDNLTIFGRFITHIHARNEIVSTREQELIVYLNDTRREEVDMQEPIAKEMLRFSSRVVEMLQASTSRVRKSIFDENGRVLREFARFKAMLSQMLKRERLDARDYCEYIINFTAKKYTKQANKLQKYLEKIEQGEDTCLRDFYNNLPNSDHDHHSEEKRQKGEEIPIRRVDFKLEIKQITPEQHDKKHSLKKTLKPSTKRRDRPHHQKNKEKPREMEEGQGEQERPNKEQTANKLLKFYSLLQLNRKQFIQDYVYEQIEQQRQKKALMIKLLQRNKQINSQISNYVRKSCAYLPVPLIIIPPPNRSSGDEHNDSHASRNSLRTSFIISKRRPSFHLDSSANEKHSQREKHSQGEVVKNLNPKRKSSHSNQRPTVSKKKLFVVKAPMVFEDQVIPQAQMNQTQRLHMPLANRYRQRRNQNVRLKKKNNPSPMQNAMLADNFRYLM